MINIYIYNKLKEIEIILLYNKLNKDFNINELNNDFNKYKNEINCLNSEINKLKKEINELKKLTNNYNINNVTATYQGNEISNLKDESLNLQISRPNENRNISYNKDKNVLMKDYNKKKVISLNGAITTIALLKNKKEIAICTTTGFLMLYNIYSFNLKLTIDLLNDYNNQKSTILDIVEFKYNNFCLSCWDNNIRFIELYQDNNKFRIIQILKGHKKYINSIRKISFYQNENIIASSSDDGTIILWKYIENNNQFNIFKEIKLFLLDPKNEMYYCIHALEESIKYNQLICSISSISQVIFCNLYNLKEIRPINVNVNRCKSFKNY
jgi:WD40 repeat protein